MPKQDIIDTSIGKVEAIEKTASTVFEKSITKYGREVLGIVGNINPATLKAELNVLLRQSGYYKGVEAYLTDAYQGIIEVSGSTYKSLYGKGFKFTDQSLQTLGNMRIIDADSFQSLATNAVNNLNTQLLTSTITPVSQAVIAEGIEKTINTFKNYTNTQVATSTAGVYRNANTLLAQDNGITKFAYVGVMDRRTRPFCETQLRQNQPKTMAEWGKEDNGQGLPVPIYMGGWNCRHTFIGVTEDVA